MKKVIILLLAFAMLTSLMSVSVAAEEWNPVLWGDDVEFITFEGDPNTYVRLPGGTEIEKDTVLVSLKDCAKAEYSMDENGLYDFYGIKVKEVIEILFSLGYRYELITEPDVNVLILCDMLNENDNILQALPNTIEHIPETPEIYGDINENGEIDSMDYILLKRAFFGTYELNDTAKENADVNQNGEIDSLDYILVKRMYFGTWSPEDASYDETVSYPIEYPAD